LALTHSKTFTTYAYLRFVSGSGTVGLCCDSSVHLHNIRGIETGRRGLAGSQSPCGGGILAGCGRVSAGYGSRDVIFDLCFDVLRVAAILWCAGKFLARSVVSAVRPVPALSRAGDGSNDLSRYPEVPVAVSHSPSVRYRHRLLPCPLGLFTTRSAAASIPRISRQAVATIRGYKAESGGRGSTSAPRCARSARPETPVRHSPTR
jgi:hypothetical protein